MAEALYRKYRPQVFEDVVGQEPIQRTLKNAIAQDKVSHAYLFCGPRGTGKTTTARLLAKALLCEHGPTPDPDGTCEDCQLIAEGAHPDVYELDAASRTGVENVREEIISRVHFAPTRGRYKVYIIDEVHMLSTAAFNALLKTLEEPPGHVVFILCTTDPQKVPETIHSRCQRFDFHRISPESMVARLGAICLAESVEFEGEALDLIAQRADGGLRNALTSLEQIIAFENGKVTLAGAERLLGSIDANDLVEIMSYIGRRDIANCFRWTAGYVETGADLANFVRDMAEHVRNLYMLALIGDDAELDVTETARRQLTSELAWFGPDRASRLLGVLGDLMAELKTTSNPRLAFEVALTRMVRPDSDLTLESLAERVEALESGYSAVAHVLPGEPVATAPAPVVEEAPPSPSITFQPEPTGQAGDAVAVGDGTRGAPSSSREAPSEPPAQAEPAFEPPAQAAPAPEPSPAPVSVAPAPASADSRLAALANPATLQRVWQATLAAIKKRKAAYGVLFMGTKALFDEASGMVKVQFPAENSFTFGTVQKPDVQDALAEALAKAAGSSVSFCFEQVGADAAPAAVVYATANPASPARVQPQPEQAPLPVQKSQPEPALAPAHEPQPEVSQGSAPVAQPGSNREQQPAPVQEAPIEQAPYDDVPFDYVPYEEFEAFEPAFEAAPEPVVVSEPEPAVAPEPVAEPEPAVAAPVEGDAAEIQALLQASFGDGVILSEANES